MVWYAKFETIIRVQHESKREYGTTPSDGRDGTRSSRGTGSVDKRRSTWWPRRSDEDVDCVKQVFIQIPKKSISRASAELEMLQMTVHRSLQKSLISSHTSEVVQKIMAYHNHKQLQSVYSTCAYKV
jgi:hypothetical protein